MPDGRSLAGLSQTVARPPFPIPSATDHEGDELVNGTTYYFQVRAEKQQPRLGQRVPRGLGHSGLCPLGTRERHGRRWQRTGQADVGPPRRPRQPHQQLPVPATGRVGVLWGLEEHPQQWRVLHRRHCQLYRHQSQERDDATTSWCERRTTWGTVATPQRPTQRPRGVCPAYPRG